jgi:hypothetical protein
MDKRVGEIEALKLELAQERKKSDFYADQAGALQAALREAMDWNWISANEEVAAVDGESYGVEEMDRIHAMAFAPTHKTMRRIKADVVRKAVHDIGGMKTSGLDAQSSATCGWNQAIVKLLTLADEVENNRREDILW